MAFYRRYRRSFKRRAPRMRRRFRGSALRRVKKDVLKCNFPTKVKFIGLPEKKVMFLTDQQEVVTGVVKEESVYPNGSGNGSKTNVETILPRTGTLDLYPTRCKNFKTLYRYEEIFKFEIDDNALYNPKAYFANWDKYCILAVYIRIQPQKNIFMGETIDNSIVPIQCYYALNNNVIFDQTATIPNTGITASMLVNGYNEKLMLDKPLFTFNSNEHCTFVLLGPQTMETDTPVVHKKYQWWSVIDQALLCAGENNFTGGTTTGPVQGELSYEEEEDISDGSIVPLGTPIRKFRCSSLPAIHCGHLFFCTNPDHTKINTIANVKLNVTINYKIALKG